MFQALFKNTRLLFFIFCAFPLLVQTGCMDVSAVNRDVIQNQAIADQALKTIEPKPRHHQQKALIVDDRPWFGARSVSIQNGEPLPPLLLQPDGLVVTFERGLTLREVARLLQAATGIRVSIRESSSERSSRRDEATTFLPVDGVEVSGGRIVWQGPLPNLLDQITDTFDAQWRYDGQSLFLQAEVTKTFMLHALSDTIDVSGSLESVDDESGVLPSVSINSDTTIEIWQEINQAVESIIDDDGRITLSPSTGTITVTGSPSVIEKVESYLHRQNKMRLRRVAVAVKVLNVEIGDINTVGFDINGVLERIVNGRPFQFSAVGADGLTAGILRSLPLLDPVTGLPSDAGTAPNADEVAALLTADEDIDRVSLSNSGAIVTLSDIPAPLQIGRTQAFVERVSSAGNDGGSSIEPGELSLGLAMNVLPRVIQNDRILLRLGLGITDLVSLESFTTAGVVIQLPNVETTGFLQNTVLSQGETLVLAGFEQDQSSIQDDGVPGGLFTGGTRTTTKTRDVTILLITAEVLPEEPLTVTHSG